MSLNSMGVAISADPHWIEAAGALAEKMGAYLGLPAPEARRAGEAVVAAATIILSARWNGTAGTGLEMAFQEGARGLELSIRYAGGPSPDQLQQALSPPEALQSMDGVEVRDDRGSRVCVMYRRLPEP